MSITKKTWGVVLIIFGVLIIVGAFIAQFKAPSSGYRYTDKILLTEQQYNTFKIACSSPNVTINSMTELNHDYPVLLTFDIISTVKSFPYGKENDVREPWGVFSLTGAAFIVAGIQVRMEFR